MPTEHLTHQFQNFLPFPRDVPYRDRLTCCIYTAQFYLVSEVFLLSAYKAIVKCFTPRILFTNNQCNFIMYTFIEILINEAKRIVDHNLQVIH